jgi:hypothetical protein
MSFNRRHSFGPYDPQRYAEAVARKIKQNKIAGGRKRLQAALLPQDATLYVWLTGEYNVAEYRTWEQVESVRKLLGPCPTFLVESIIDWGGLTEKQLAFARKIYEERCTKTADRAVARLAETAALTAAGVAWTAGRQTVEVKLLSKKMSSGNFPSMKGLFQREDGAKLWCSLPKIAGGEYEIERGDVVRFSIEVQLKEGSTDLTFAFGSRPTKGALLSRGTPQTSPEGN